MDTGWLIGICAAVMGLAIVAGLVWKPLRAARQESLLARARRSFHRQREWLEARFFQLAASSGKPRGLAWADIDFDDEVTYARHRRSGQISAFVSVAISFEAIPGGGMEEVEAVGNVRAATAVFQYRAGKWTTEGRALFNLNPVEAIRYYQSSLELVDQPH